MLAFSMSAVHSVYHVNYFDSKMLVGTKLEMIFKILGSKWSSKNVETKVENDPKYRDQKNISPYILKKS